MSVKKERFDLDKEIKISRYQIIQLILLCLSAGAGIALINGTLGFVVLGMSILFLLFPIINKIMGNA